MSLRLTGITAGYGGPPVLRGVDLAVDPGELLSVLGPSGSGKTTLLRVVAGLHRPDAGRILIDGQDLTRAPPERRRIGLVPQDGALFGHVSVASNIAYGLRGVRGRRAAARHPRVRELLGLVGLDGLAERLPHQLSGGQQQRVALARALAPRPALVLLDEPFSSLDASLREHVRDEVTAVLRAAGVAALLITHDQDEALSLGEQVAVLRDGVVVQHGTPEEVYRRPVDRWVAAFVGDAVLLPGVAGPGGATTALGLVPVASRAPGADGDRPTVLVRPEQLRLDEAVIPGAGAPGVVRRVQFFGHDRLVHLDLVGVDEPPSLRARLPAGPPLTPGQRVTVSIEGAGHALGR